MIVTVETNLHSNLLGKINPIILLLDTCILQSNNMHAALSQSDSGKSHKMLQLFKLLHNCNDHIFHSFRFQHLHN